MTTGPERSRRRRRGARGGRGQGRAPLEQPSSTTTPARRPMPTWRWLRLPVAIAFALGVVVLWLLGDSDPARILFVVSLFILAFGGANIISRRIIELRRSTRER